VQKRCGPQNVGREKGRSEDFHLQIGPRSRLSRAGKRQPGLSPDDASVGTDWGLQPIQQNRSTCANWDDSHAKPCPGPDQPLHQAERQTPPPGAPGDFMSTAATRCKTISFWTASTNNTFSEKAGVGAPGIASLESTVIRNSTSSPIHTRAEYAAVGAVVL